MTHAINQEGMGIGRAWRTKVLDQGLKETHRRDTATKQVRKGLEAGFPRCALLNYIASSFRHSLNLMSNTS